MIIENNKIKMIRGDTESLTVPVFMNGTLLPLTPGDIAYLTVRKTTKSPIVAMQKVATDFVEGKAEFYISYEDTKDLDFGEYVYDVQVTFKDGSRKTVLLPEQFFIMDEVTYD